MGEGGEARIPSGGHSCDHEEDRARAGAAAADRASTAAFAAVVGDRRQADDLGDGLVGEAVGEPGEHVELA